MIKTLYEKFQSWSEKGSIWVYSDPHFEDEDTKLMDPNWIDPQEQVDIINKLVYKNDTLIMLGDIGKVEWISKIKAGYKVLITGNHDLGNKNYIRNLIDWPVDYKGNVKATLEHLKRHHPDWQYRVTEDNIIISDNKLFDEVYDGPLMIADKIILSHEPIPNINWALNICGHDHSGRCNDKYHYCVCSNTINYAPVNLKDIINSGRLKEIDSLHRITIDNATKNPMDKGK